jgi:dihydrofolate reductase
MRKLKITEHISLDGVIQHSADDGDFPYSYWTAPYRTPAGRDAILAAYGEGFDLLLGRRTYDLWSGVWPKAPSSPMADRLNAATKYIATHRPESLEWGRRAGAGVSTGQHLPVFQESAAIVRFCQVTIPWAGRRNFPKVP